MTASVFLRYECSRLRGDGNGKEELKRQRALDLIEHTGFWQFGSGLAGVFRNRSKEGFPALSAAPALEWIEQWIAFPCQSVDHQLVRIAIALSERHKILYWDPGIVAAREALGAHTVYSEDLNNGQRYGKIRVVNPFA